MILSLPYLRCARALLAPQLVEALAGRTALTVVAPDGAEGVLGPSLRRQGVTAEFLVWRAPDPGALGRTLLAISELLRVNGYFRRHRQALPQYWQNLFTQPGDEGQDGVKPLRSRIVALLSGVFGAVPGLWRLIERLAATATGIHRIPALESLAETSDAVTLIQCANWGEQDRQLRLWAGRHGIRKVLIPYTTDQFWVNGYLPPDYAMLCPQGAFEEKCLRDLHDTGPARIVPLGNLWFRYAEALREDLRDRAEPAATIIYAGVSEPYFPKSSEIAAIERLHAAHAAGEFGTCRLVYRPYARSDGEREQIAARVAHLEGLELQWPQKTSSSFEFTSGVAFETDLRDYVRQLSGCEVLVMSHTTTLGMDASFLGAGVVSNFWDPTGTMERRSSHLRFDETGRFDWWPELPIVHDGEALVVETRRQLFDRPAREAVREGLLREWDFNPPDLSAQLDRVLFANSAPEICEAVPA